MGIVEQRTTRQLEPLKQTNSTFDRITDLFVFLFSIVVAIAVLAAVFIAAPIALALSVLAGLLTHNRDRNGWRSANA